MSIDNETSRVLDALEAEAIWVFRETAAAFERPVLLYSIGKDSTVLLHLARKAFFPGKLPCPVMHVDTRWKFQEMYSFRDKMVAEHIPLPDVDLSTVCGELRDMVVAEVVDEVLEQLLRAAMAAHRMPAWPGERPIALVESAPGAPPDWHVFWQWRHLGSAHDEAAARELAARHRPPGTDQAVPAPAIEPEVYSLLRARLATGPSAPGRVVEL